MPKAKNPITEEERSKRFEEESKSEKPMATSTKTRRTFIWS
jgi:hypothetical protein